MFQFISVKKNKLKSNSDRNYDLQNNEHLFLVSHLTGISLLLGSLWQTFCGLKKLAHLSLTVSCIILKFIFTMLENMGLFSCEESNIFRTLNLSLTGLAQLFIHNRACVFFSILAMKLQQNGIHGSAIMLDVLHSRRRRPWL